MGGNESTIKVLAVGVGGQGVLTLARLLGDAALAQGLQVRVGQLHGMAQRGGSVEALALLGPGQSTFIGDGEADVVVGLEPLEALRALPRISGTTRVLVSAGQVTPFSMVRQGQTYPPLDEVLAPLRARAAQVQLVQTPQLLAQAEAPRSLNICMLGALAGLGVLPLDRDVLWAAVRRRVPPRHLEPNRRAFELGAEAG